MKNRFEPTERFALRLDRDDPLARFRKRFLIPESTVYMDGNSLGLLSVDAEAALRQTLDTWKNRGIQGWFQGPNPWLGFAEALGALVAPLVGAGADEVIATGTTTSNIHSMLSTFYRPRGKRTKILADRLTFPTDLYAIRSHLHLRGYPPPHHLVLAGSADGRMLDEEEIIRSMNRDVALVFLPSVLYRSGQLLDMAALAGAARRKGIPVGFDCSHSVGAVPHAFEGWDIDFAVWCSYKYLNGGPGAPAFLYIRREHFQETPGMAGWFGYAKKKQFDMLPEFEHQKSAAGWQISSPGILGSAPLFGSLNLIREAGIEAVREKSLALTAYLIRLIDEFLTAEPYRFRIGTPREEHRRGGHVALERDTHARQICEALEAAGIVPDFRPPDIIRIAPVALYNTFHEVWRVVRSIQRIVDERAYR